VPLFRPSFSHLPLVSRSLFLIGLICFPFQAHSQFFEPNRANRNLTPADSLAAFRPDSLDAGMIDRLESGRTAKDSLEGKNDSLKLVSSLKSFDQRPPTYALHLGIGFLDLQSAALFESDLNAKLTSARGRLLQPYEPVHLYFPFGIEVGKRFFDYFDFIGKTHSFWYRQTGLYSDSALGRNQESFFVVQGHLAGFGGKLYIPKEMLSAKNRGLVYLQIMRFWDVVGNEVYTDRGSAKAEWSPLGSATEIQLGFSQVLDASWTWSAALTFFHAGWKSPTPWNEVLQVTNTEPAQWGGNALQLRFYLFWNPKPLPKMDSGNPAKP
jgi:hypothetical protein